MLVSEPATRADSADFDLEQGHCMTTFGIEEEYFLVNPTTLRPVCLAAVVLRDLSRDSSEGECVTGEFLAHQVERSTAILTDIEEAEADLTRFRAKLASAARLQGAMAVGTGTPSIRSRRR